MLQVRKTLNFLTHKGNSSQTKKANNLRMVRDLYEKLQCRIDTKSGSRNRIAMYEAWRPKSQLHHNGPLNKDGGEVTTA